MAISASDLRLGHISFGFFTVSPDLNAPLKKNEKRADNLQLKFHVLAGIGARNLRHRAGFAQVRRPALSLLFEQAAFLQVPAPEIITVKMRALPPGRRFHG